MGLIGAVARTVARRHRAQLHANALAPAVPQDEVLAAIIQRAGLTSFGREHEFVGIRSYADFRGSVPVRTFQDFEPWLGRAETGELNVCWPGPLTVWDDGRPTSMEGLRSTLYALRECLADASSRARINSGKVTLLSDGGRSLLPQEVAGVNWWSRHWLNIRDSRDIAGSRTSVGVVCGHEDQLSQLAAGVATMVVQDGLPAGPSETPHMRIVCGPGREILAVQPPGTAALTPIVDAGVFFEFVPVAELQSSNPTRLTVSAVEPHTDYALVVTTNSGLFACATGDVVRFSSTQPLQIEFV